ncbi:IclR family transcriptional regulator [Azospirillum baldaniorum]|uniref:IclR family transcriptional regulator domain-containing protein n=1 Tax=Azospirillum baldaniorum TaxID=1064539 RepID=UPI0011A83BD1|nr:IclR family transcriptional regulator C-terminal domain-containing protein [Azospirillum baldaniorum]TWA57328.1 IclR family transcriptional regulator [Azospirillum baldaniorum]
MEKDSQPFIRALARGLDVIEAMSNQPRGMSLSEVAAAVSLDRATARRILLTLKDRGYVRMLDRNFILAPRVLNLGFAYLSSMPLWHIAAPYLRELAETADAACSVGVLDGTEVVYMAREQSIRRRTTLHVDIGMRFPLHCTSMGKILLAGLPEEELEALLDQLTLTQHTPNTITGSAALREAVATVRREGWAVSDQEFEDGIRSVAVPLRNRAGTVIAAMNVSSHAGRLSRDDGLEGYVARHLPPLRDAAREIECALRARP